MQIVTLIILVAINAFFAASEMAFVTLNDAKIASLAKEGNKKAKKIQKMLNKPSKFLATIQIGITLAGFLSSAFAADTFVSVLAPVLQKSMPFFSIEIWQGISLVLITILLSFFTLIFGELVPKRIAMKFSEKVAFFAVGPIHFVSVITAPFVAFLTASTNFISKLFGISETDEETVTEEEIRMMVNQGGENGAIDDSEQEMINNVFEFNDKEVSEIMIYRTEIFAVDGDTTVAEFEKIIEKENYRYSRIPVYDKTIDNMQGVVYLKDILKAKDNKNDSSTRIKKITRKILFFPESKFINDAFKEMQVNKIQMAVVLDEYGGTTGIVTMEDILEELVGDIYDEYDKVEFKYEKLDDNTFRLDGSMPIFDVNKIMEIELPEGDYDTLSGFIINELDRIPEDNERPTVETPQAVFKVTKIQNRKIERVKACRTKTLEGKNESVDEG
ncbi:MAG: HlyC/CorC family transporter [Clostridia bacterium]|nr:HlyC/CorC family transporter [Clostridia bacterium]MBR3255748.1 HlyC/CorC family transporter [Clostridia bacterium]